MMEDQLARTGDQVFFVEEASHMVLLIRPISRIVVERSFHGDIGAFLYASGCPAVVVPVFGPIKP